MVKNDDRMELMIVSPMDQSPALHSGILAGDIIESIDGEEATDATINALVSRLTGPVGTDVVLMVRHPNGEKEEYHSHAWTYYFSNYFRINSS